MENELVSLQIENKIIVIRGVQVMIDRDLAELYGVETKVLNQAVKRNIERFPEHFMFQLHEEEFLILRSQTVTSKPENRGGRQYLPYVFTEQGCAMLSAVLRSDTAVQVSIKIMDAFVSMRHFLQSNTEIFAELKSLQHYQMQLAIHQKEADKRIDQLFTLMDKYNVKDEQGIFFQGQIFDAYAKFESFIAQATKEIILIDGYVDLSILQRLAKKKSRCKHYYLHKPQNKAYHPRCSAFQRTISYPYIKIHDKNP